MKTIHIADSEGSAQQGSIDITIRLAQWEIYFALIKFNVARPIVREKKITDHITRAFR